MSRHELIARLEAATGPDVRIGAYGKAALLMITRRRHCHPARDKLGASSPVASLAGTCGLLATGGLLAKLEPQDL